jgi:ABC-2 type transport system permease protein
VKAQTLFGSLRSSKFRHGGYATLMIVAALAVIIAVNLLVDQVPAKLDLTENKLFSLSEETLKILGGLSSDVTITSISRKASEDPTVKEILSRYAQKSGHVKLATVDPERNPGWSKQYDATGSGLREGSLVVARGARFRTIDVLDMYNYDMSGQQPRLTSLSVEQKVSSALAYVTADRNVTAYALQGHGEQTLAGYGLTGAVDAENYERQELNLLTLAAVPAEADMVLVLSPKSDVPAQEAEKLRAYLASGGRALFLLDVQNKAESLPNLAAVLRSYGVAMRNLLVVETDANRAAYGNPLFLVPNQESHEILAPLRAKNYPILMPFAQPIQSLELRKNTLTIAPLLTSTAQAFAKANSGNIGNLRREAGDAGGPFTVAVAITDPAAEPGGRDTRIVVIGASTFLVSEVAAQAPGNTDFFLNCMGWLKEKKDTISIRAKSMIEFPLNLNSAQRWIFSAVVVILMPLIILGWGFIVWMKRRHL